MAGISRVHGYTQAGSFYGLQPSFYLITNTAASVGTANSPATPDGTAITEGNFEKAVRGIEKMASIVFIGPRADGGFLVGIDAGTANAYVSANTNTDVGAALVAAIQAATGLSDVSATVKTLALAQFA